MHLVRVRFTGAGSAAADRDLQLHGAAYRISGRVIGLDGSVGGMKGGRQVLRISVEENEPPAGLWKAVWLVLGWMSCERLSDEQSASTAMSDDHRSLRTDRDGRQGTVWYSMIVASGGATLRCSDVMNQYLVDQMAQPAGRFAGNVPSMPVQRLSGKDRGG